MNSAAISFLEKVSVPCSDEATDITEDVSLSDAIYATKIAKLELLTELQEYIKDHYALNAVIDDKIRQLKKERVKL